jgi:hypothetical protein
MLDDMRMRKFGEKTQLDYVRAVRNFTKYLGRSPDTASVEDLRNYQLHLVDHGISPASLNAASSFPFKTGLTWTFRQFIALIWRAPFRVVGGNFCGIDRET